MHSVVIISIIAAPLSAYCNSILLSMTCIIYIVGSLMNSALIDCCVWMVMLLWQQVNLDTHLCSHYLCTHLSPILYTFLWLIDQMIMSALYNPVFFQDI